MESVRLVIGPDDGTASIAQNCARAVILFIFGITCIRIAGRRTFHPQLMKSVARRIVDPRVLHLIRLWLDCAVEETDDKGRKTRTTAARDQRRGIPQG
jgi:hypothetical protein